MILGIIKNDKEIRGHCEIKETVNSYNKVLTVFCESIPATINDNIIYKCDKCGKEESIHKRNFFKANKHINCLCQKCKTEQTSMERYGIKSHNQLAAIKQKQHKSKKVYVDGNTKKPPKTKTKEELSQLRSENSKKLWIKGVYDNADYSTHMKQAWSDPEKRKKILAGMNTPGRKKKYSEDAKKTWENPEYRNKMSKIGIRISKFQLEVYEEEVDRNQWLLEYPIPDSTRTADMCNPDTKEIIECYGDYWHCNPKKFNEDYYNKRVHKTAKEIWDADQQRIKELEDLSYTVEIIWESDWKAR